MSRGEGVEQQAGCRLLGSSTAARGELAGVGGGGWGAKGPNPTPASLPRRRGPFFDTLQGG